jgi:hypothetical protein
VFLAHLAFRPDELLSSLFVFFHLVSYRALKWNYYSNFSSVWKCGFVCVGVFNLMTYYSFYRNSSHAVWLVESPDIILKLETLLTKIVSNSPDLHRRWPPLLKIEISSNGQNCNISNQNEQKFRKVALKCTCLRLGVLVSYSLVLMIAYH